MDETGDRLNVIDMTPIFFWYTTDEGGKWIKHRSYLSVRELIDFIEKHKYEIVNNRFIGFERPIFHSILLPLDLRWDAISKQWVQSRDNLIQYLDFLDENNNAFTNDHG